MSDANRTTHSTTQLLGQTVLAATLIVILGVIVFVIGEDEFLAVMVVTALIAVGLAVLLWKVDKLWSRIVALVGSVLILLTTWFFVFGVFQPFSPLEFTVGISYIIGIVLALVGGIMAIVAGRKGRTGQTPREAKLRPIVLSIIGLAAVVSIAGFLVTRTTVSDAEAAGAVHIEMKDFEFDPEDSTVAAGGKLLVSNSDLFVHDFTWDEFDIEVTIGPGSEELIEIPASAAGSYDYFCSLHSDGETGMMGTITIGS